MSTAHQAQPDGQTEIVNRYLQQYIHAFCHVKTIKVEKILNLGRISL